jgi:hypothetical protein
VGKLFLRGFPDRLPASPMKAEIYEAELWKRELTRVLMPMREKCANKD